jgi:hypothetical protein
MSVNDVPLIRINWGQIPIVFDVQGAFGLLCCLWLDQGAPVGLFFRGLNH